ncbi:MAG TPA: hypothetical protein VK963_03725 [Candidatus Saccharimonadales bacterium]|nr:hypothetical protein [Candidatus Saccharimonadales bacterium]
MIPSPGIPSEEEFPRALLLQYLKRMAQICTRPVYRPAALVQYGHSSLIATEANLKNAAEKTLQLFTFLQISGCRFVPICSHKDTRPVSGAFLLQRFKGAENKNW